MILNISGVLVVGIFLVVAWYGLSPLFISVKVDESLPAVINVETEMASVLGTPGHPAEGSVHIINDGGTYYLRYENFKTLNGPDLYVYLATAPDGKEFIDLGRLRATEGNVNYEIPSGVNPQDYPYALTWCKQFGVLFNSAKLY